MASLLGWLGGAVKGAENAIGGVVNNVEQDVGRIFHPQNQAPSAPVAPPQALGAINQSTGFAPGMSPQPTLTPPPAINPLQTQAQQQPPDTISQVLNNMKQKPGTPPAVQAINNSIGGSPVQQAQAAPQNPNAKQVNPLQAVASNLPGAIQAANPINIINRAAVPVGQFVANQAAPAITGAINKADNNFNLPVLGNVGQQVGGMVGSLGSTLTHAGQLSQGQNPYAGMNAPQAAGSAITDALNVATLGKGAAIAHAGEALGAPIAERLGGGLLGKAAGNFVGTTVTTAPLTAAYGGAGVLQQGDTNPGDIAKGAVQGLAAAPVFGAIHGAVPIAKAGAGKVGDIVNSPLVQNEVGGAGKNIPEETLNSLINDSGMNRDQFTQKIADQKNTIIQNELQNMKQELQQGGVTQGNLIRDNEGNVTGRFGRQSTNPDWYKDLYSQGYSKQRLISAIDSGNLDTKTGQALQDVADKRLSGQYEDSAAGKYPANTQYLGAKRVLDSLNQSTEATQPPTEAKPQVEAIKPDKLVISKNGAIKTPDGDWLKPDELRYLAQQMEKANQPAKAQMYQGLLDRYNASTEPKAASPKAVNGAPTYPDKLHVGKPTPASSANLDDVNSVGTALGKTRTYIKRAETYIKNNPEAKDALSQHLEALQNDKAALNQRFAELKNKPAPTPEETFKAVKPTAALKMAPEDLANRFPKYSYFDQFLKDNPRVAKYLEKSGVSDTQALYDQAAAKENAATQAQAKALGVELPQKPTGNIQANSDKALADNISKEGLKTRVDDTNKTTKATRKAIVGERTAEENTALNPEKRTLPTVNEADYEKARSNPQLVANDVQNHALQALQAVKQLSKDEKPKFWKTVEGTEKSTSPQMDEAVSRWRDLANTVHAWSQAHGGNTNYIMDYARHVWDLSDPKDAARFAQLYEERFPDDFKGLDREHRLFATIAEGEKAGFKLKNPNNPAEDIMDYAAGSSARLSKDAMVKGFAQADAAAQAAQKAEGKSLHKYDIGNEQTIPLSDQGRKEIRTFEKLPENAKLLKGYDAINRELKAKLLSLSAFHVNNVGEQMSATQVGLPKDYLTGEAHPRKGVSAIPMAYRAIADTKYADTKIQEALKDGTLRDAARIGYPIREGSDYEATGKLSLKGNWGEGATFERALPVMQIDAARGLLADMKARGIDLDSIEARKIGKTAYEISGFMNRQLRNFDPRVQRVISRFLLAPQFTMSKWSVLWTAATNYGMAGNLARRAVVGKYLTDVLIAGAVGAAVGQNSDNIKDFFVRELIHPSIPTPWKDAKRNNIELGLPANYTSEVLGLVAGLGRNQDGRMTINANPGNIPSNLLQYGRNRLAMLPGDALKVATNENYAGKPLYDPNANLGTQIGQAATTLATNSLPIGLQGLPQLGFIKDKLPQSAQDVLNAQNTSGSNPLLKSVASSFGVTPRTDKTVGQGLQTTQYFAAVNQAKQGLNRQAKDAVDLWTGSKKNPVTGQYDVMPNVNDARAKATALLQNPSALDNLIAMNSKIASQGGKVDPLWVDPATGQPRDKAQITAYLQYQAMPPKSSDQANWIANNPWYTQGDNALSTQRQTFFGSLPKGDPNKPNAPIEFPTPDPQTAQLMKDYFNTTDSKVRAQMIQNNPSLTTQFQKQDDYYNQMRVAQGYAPLISYPTSTPQIQAELNAKNYKAPDAQNYLNQVAVYNAIHGLAQDQYQGTTPTSQTLKAVQNLANYGIVKNPDGTLALAGSGNQQSGAVASGGSSRRYSSSGGMTASKRRSLKFANQKVHASTVAFNKLVGGGGTTTKKVKPFKANGLKTNLPYTRFPKTTKA